MIKSNIADIREKIDISRYKISILQELFAVPPECDGYHEPENKALFYLGVKTLLDEIMNGNTEATDDLSDLSMEVPA
jgi:hypothetical protein